MSEILDAVCKIIDKSSEDWKDIKVSYENAQENEDITENTYELFDSIYEQLGYDYNLYHEMQVEDIHSTSDLIEYLLSKDKVKDTEESKTFSNIVDDYINNVIDVERRKTINDIVENYVNIDDTEYRNSINDDFIKNSLVENNIMQNLWLNTIMYVYNYDREDMLFSHVEVKSKDEIVLHFIEPNNINITINKNMTTSEVKALSELLK